MIGMWAVGLKWSQACACVRLFEAAGAVWYYCSRSKTRHDLVRDAV